MIALVSFGFTVCEVAEEGLIAAKRITQRPDGSVWKSDYDKVMWWRFRPVVAASHEAMADRLCGLAMLPRRMIIMGCPIGSLDLGEKHLRRWADPAEATLCAVARAWLPLDFDSVAVPEGLGLADRVSDAALHVRDHLLPAEFHGVRMVAAPSARTGMVGDSVARLRLFAALDRAHPLGALKDWAKCARVGLNLPLDASVLQAGQPIYTARPKFTGMNDPVPRGMRAVILPGSKDMVTLEVGRFDVKPEIVAPNGKENVPRNTQHLGKAPVVEGTVPCVAISCGQDWRRRLEATVGGPDGFFEPLKKGIGTAVRVGAKREQIEAAIAALLAARADAHRRQAYGPEWVNRAIASFQRHDAARDAADRAAYARDLARIFQNERDDNG
jgi:hypothetical protein